MARVQGSTTGSGTEGVVRLVPSLALSTRGGRAVGSVVYGGALVARRGIDDREETEYLNQLSAAYAFEVIDRTGYIDARASISQQAISASGTPVDTSQPGSNRTEVRTVSLAPYLRGSMGGLANFEARVTGTISDSDAAAAVDSKSAQASVALRSPSPAAIFGWGLNATRQKVKFSNASAATTSDRVAADLSFRPDIDWRLSVTGGSESTDIVGATRQTYETYGAGVQWTPSPRTTVLLQADERYFGRSHRISLQYRLPRGTLRYSDSRDVTNASDVLTSSEFAATFERLFAEYEAQFPNPAERAQFVLDLIQSGAANSAGISVQRRRDLAWTWGGPRLTMTVSGFTVAAERVDRGGVNAPGPNDNTEQSGYAGSLGWRLTPQTSIAATGSRAMSHDTVSDARSDLKSVSLVLATQLGRQTTGALGARYAVLNGTPDANRRASITGSISLRF